MAKTPAVLAEIAIEVGHVRAVHIALPRSPLGLVGS